MASGSLATNKLSDRCRRPIARLLRLLIDDWQEQWQEGEFPLYIVQIANSLRPSDEANAVSRWAAPREAQRTTAAGTPNCGLAVTIDLGEADHIHLVRKREVGHRFAPLALTKTYGRAIESSGPSFRSFTIEGCRIRMQFDHARGLTARGGALEGFAMAGADHRFVHAQAEIDNVSVVVSSPQVLKPIAVRYAWGR
ncbi:MAG TPA: hypothetical protein VHZ24_17390 [Pirellulales bacterium]|jgi:sialate O-acetylesterase|nr:hypothetical protein [Pirellulales bacterium]